MDNLAQQAITAAINGNWKTAVTANQRILAENPQNLEAMTRLANALAQLGKTKEAIGSYQKILSLEPHNVFANKGLAKLKKITSSTKGNGSMHELRSTFLEEPGKTKTITLVHTATPATLAQLDAGQPLTLSPKRHRISVTTEDGAYIGRLPDDIALRLLGFMEGGNRYEAAIKAVDNDCVKIFVREIYRAKKFETTPSFTSDINFLTAMEEI